MFFNSCVFSLMSTDHTLSAMRHACKPALELQMWQAAPCAWKDVCQCLQKSLMPQALQSVKQSRQRLAQ